MRESSRLAQDRERVQVDGGCDAALYHYGARTRHGYLLQRLDGKPRKAGLADKHVELTVATLPDLSKMISKTYVNEVDVRKVKSGQKVDVGLDAYPDKRLSGWLAA